MRYLLLTLLIASFLLPGSMALAQEGPRLHPWLVPLLDKPTEEIPSLLSSDFAGAQGRRTFDGKKALSLELATTAKRSELEALGIEVRSLIGDIATVTVPLSELSKLAEHPEIQAIMLPRPVLPNLNQAVPASGIDHLRTLAGGIASGATGDGVIIGVIDSGIDWDHPSFVRADGSSRIVNLWDQTIDGTATPMWFSYGTEWSAADIDAGIVTEEDNRLAYGHGTHVTGIAAGNGRAPDASGMLHTYSGVAPEADIIAVKTDFFSDSIVDGLHYIFLRAFQLNRPAVINLSLGGQIGSHDGGDAMERAIDQLTEDYEGRAVVVAAGNDRQAANHAHINVAQGQTVSLEFEVDYYAPLATGPNNDQILVVGYYDESDDLTLHLRTPTGNNYSLDLDPFFSSPGCTDLMWSGSGSILLCNNDASNMGQVTDANEIVIFVTDEDELNRPGIGTWNISLTGNTINSDGAVDFWLASSLGNFSNRTNFTNHLESERTLGIPATSEQAIVVGAYQTKDCWTAADGSAQSFTQSDLGDIAAFSSRGPTRDGRGKPDLAAPGAGVVSALAEEAQGLIAGSSNSGLLVDDYHLMLQGTSMATPMVTGAVALFFEEDDNRTPDDLRAMLKDMARRDQDTAQYDEWVAVGAFPTFLRWINNAFGAGKLDLGSWNSSDPNESNDSVHQATAVLSGQAVQGRLEHSGDEDYFELDHVLFDDQLDIELTQLTADFRLDLHRFLPNPSCGGPYSVIEATSDVVGTASELITETVSNGNTRFFNVSAPSGVVDPQNDYEVRAVITRQETPNAHQSFNTAQHLGELVEMNVDGRIFNQEDDYYTVQAGPFTNISLQISPCHRFAPRLEIYDANEDLVADQMTPCSLTYNTGFTPGRAVTGFYVVVGDNSSSYVLNVRVD